MSTTTPASTPASDLMGSDDRTLVARATEGDERSFEAIFHRHVRSVRGFVVVRVGPDVAEDVVVETFAAAWRSLATFDPAFASARPWLYGIAVRVLARHRDSERRWCRDVRAGCATLGADDPGPDGPVEPDESLIRALARLHPRERDVLLLVALGELSLVESARVLGITAGAARLRMLRARRSMTRDLGGRHDR